MTEVINDQIHSDAAIHADDFDDTAIEEVAKTELDPKINKNKGNKEAREEEYDTKRFSEKDIEALKNFVYRRKGGEEIISYTGIPAETANVYHEYFSVKDVCKLFGGEIKKFKSSYKDSLDGGKDVTQLRLIPVLPDVANAFYEVYNAQGRLSKIPSTQSIIKLNGYQILAELSAIYDDRFSPNGIIYCVKRGISGYDVSKFSKKFNERDILVLIKRDISYAKANGYDKRFNGGDIINLVAKKISNEVANGYDKRFDVYEIIDLVAKKISNEVVNGYDKRFNGRDIINLVAKKISNEVAVGYDKRFNGGDIINLVAKKISNEVANGYDKRFNGGDIINLVAKKISNEVAVGYDKRFNGGDIINLVAKKISNEVAVGYDKRFNGRDIINLVAKKISNEVAVGYDKRFNWLDIINLVAKKISNEVAVGYDKRFDGYDIKRLVELKISNEVAVGYDKEFNVSEIIKFIKKGYDSSIVNQYIPYFEHDYTLSTVIISFLENEIYPDHLMFQEKNRKELRKILYNKGGGDFDSTGGASQNQAQLNFKGTYNPLSKKTSFGNTNKLQTILETLDIPNEKLFTINPPIYEHFKETTLSLDPDNILNPLEKKSYTYEINKYSQVEKNMPVHMMSSSTEIPGDVKYPIMLPLGYVVTNIFLGNSKIPAKLGKEINLYRDLDGNFSVVLLKKQKISIQIAKGNTTVKGPTDADKVALMQEVDFPDKLLSKKFQEVMNKAKTPSMKAKIVKIYVQGIGRYGKNNEADAAYASSFLRNISDYSSDEYIQNMFDYYEDKGEITMICNQSALLATALLRKYGINARIAVGMMGGSKLEGVGHARVEYRDGKQRVTMDPTPNIISKYNEVKILEEDPNLEVNKEKNRKEEERKKSIVVGEWNGPEEYNPNIFIPNFTEIKQKNYTVDDYLLGCEKAVSEIDSIMGIFHPSKQYDEVSQIFSGYTKNTTQGEIYVGLQNNLIKVNKLKEKGGLTDIQKDTITKYERVYKNVDTWIKQTDDNDKYLLAKQDEFNTKIQQAFDHYVVQKNVGYEYVMPQNRTPFDLLYEKYGSYDKYKPRTPIFWSIQINKPDRKTWSSSKYIKNHPEKRLEAWVNKKFEIFGNEILGLLK